MSVSTETRAKVAQQNLVRGKKEAIPPRGPTGNTQTLSFIVRVAKFASSSSESAWPSRLYLFVLAYCHCLQLTVALSGGILLFLGMYTIPVKIVWASLYETVCASLTNFY